MITKIHELSLHHKKQLNRAKMLLKISVFHSSLRWVWKQADEFSRCKACSMLWLLVVYLIIMIFQTVTSSAFVIRSIVTEGDKRDVYMFRRICASSFLLTTSESHIKPLTQLGCTVLNTSILQIYVLKMSDSTYYAIRNTALSYDLIMFHV